MPYLDGFVPGRGYTAPSPKHDVRFNPQGWYYLSRTAANPITRPYRGAGPGHWIAHETGWVWRPFGQQFIGWRGRSVEVYGVYPGSTYDPGGPLRPPWVQTLTDYWVNGPHMMAAQGVVTAPSLVHAGLL